MSLCVCAYVCFVFVVSACLCVCVCELVWVGGGGSGGGSGGVHGCVWGWGGEGVVSFLDDFSLSGGKIRLVICLFLFGPVLVCRNVGALIVQLVT